MVPPGMNPGQVSMNMPMNMAGHPIQQQQQQAMQQAQPQAQKPPQQMQQQHAITYVTTIRNRFANEPETYRAFLRILHTYQKEQKGIKDVLEQVSQLFADHPDLLMEFTYFLPDSVQEQAKERLQRAARESEARRKAGITHTSMMGGMLYNQQMGMGIGPANMAGAKRRRWAADQGRGMGGPIDGGRGRGNHIRKVPGGRRIGPDGMEVDERGSYPKPVFQGGNYDPTKNVGPPRVGGPFNQQFGPSSTNGLAKVPSALAGTKVQQQSFSYYSATAERRFFDQAKEILTQNSRETWSEFVKCLDLFSSGAITKADMLVLVKDLFGGLTGHDLFDEFKRLLSVRSEYEARGSDLWYAVPLSEIDFTQCRKCTPSYRALPKDYPKPICSERSPTEAVELNDTWVSIPIGSEESYSFKHMRKNQYEEALFKCEDERFEIDMIIDSNMSTIRLLEPIEQEIIQLTAIEDSEAANPNAGTSLSPKFNFQLDKRNLTTVHLNAITRIYGEHGAEILDLLRKNPVGTIPVLLKRLKQKDSEWRKARLELNKQWKEVILKNYEKSFDHRSFYFRQQDKRIFNQKYLVSEIKYAIEGSDMILPTDGKSSQQFAMPTEEELKHAELARSVTAEHVPQLKGMIPHLVMKYDSHEYDIHRDIYRLLSHASETTTATPFDKERQAALWRDMFRVFFKLPTDFLYASSATPLQEKAGPARADNLNVWLSGTRVATVYGSGRIISHRSADNFYQVQLAYGIAFLRPSTILGAEELSSQALKVIGVASTATSGTDTVYQGNVAPGTGNMKEKVVKPPSKLFFGTQMAYIFLRLHHIIYTRLCFARQLAKSESASMTSAHPLASMEDASDDEMERRPELLDSAGKPLLGKGNVNRYSVYLGQLYSLLSGAIDSSRYEDSCRLLLGNRCYVLYTLDKVIAQTVKCLHAMANDDIVHKLVGLFVYHQSPQSLSARGSPESATSTLIGPTDVDPEFYLNHVAAILSHTMEDVYRMQLLVPADSASPYIEVACQYIGNLNTTSGVSSSIDTKAPQLVLEDDEDDEMAGDGDGDAIGEKRSMTNQTHSVSGESADSALDVEETRDDNEQEGVDAGHAMNDDDDDNSESS